MTLPIYLRVRLPKEIDFPQLTKYFSKEFDNYLSPTNDYVNLRIQNMTDHPSYYCGVSLADTFKTSKIRYTESASGIILSDCFSANGGFGLLDITTISKAFSDLEFEYAISCGDDGDWTFSIWKDGKKIKDNLNAEDCVLGRMLVLLDAKEFTEGDDNMTNEELYQTLIKLGMIDEEETPQDLFEDTCSDLPALMSFVNDLFVNNGQDVIKQLLINLIYKK